jgi:hypothetical protein
MFPENVRVKFLDQPLMVGTKAIMTSAMITPTSVLSELLAA